MIRTTVFGLVVSVLVGCTVPLSTMSRPDAYYNSAITAQAGASLFSGDAAILSDDAINTILSYKYTPPKLSRVALMPFGREIWSNWSEELSLASEQIQTNVIDQLMSAPSVYDASYLPSILIPERRTVPHLREAAARYQADLLLVYRSYCQTFERYRIFAADRSRAYCGVEAVLLDTRTGLVPFTSVASESYDVTENKADTNFRETRLRAQLEATAQALAKVSSEVVEFLAASD